MSRSNVGDKVTGGIHSFASFVVARQQQRAISEKNQRAAQAQQEHVEQQAANYKNYKRDARFKNKALESYGDNPEMQALIHKTEASQTDPRLQAALQERYGADASRVMDRERSGRMGWYANQAQLQKPVGQQAVESYTEERTAMAGILNKQGQIESNMGKIDPGSPLGKKIIGGLESGTNT